MPQDMTIDQREGESESCTVHLSWNSPINTAVRYVDHYMVHINGRHVINESSDENITSTTYSACSCAPHNVSIRAVNRCGHIGQSTPNITLIPEDKKPLPTLVCNQSPSRPITEVTTGTPPDNKPCHVNRKLSCHCIPNHTF